MIFKAYRHVETVDQRELDDHIKSIINLLQLKENDTFTVNRIRQIFRSQTTNKISSMNQHIRQLDYTRARETCQTIVLYTECRTMAIHWINMGIDLGLWYEVNSI